MKRKDVNCNPQDIDKDNWFYDGKKYLTFIHQVRNENGDYIQTDEFKVSIKQLSDFIAEMK